MNRLTDEELSELRKVHSDWDGCHIEDSDSLSCAASMHDALPALLEEVTTYRRMMAIAAERLGQSATDDLVDLLAELKEETNDKAID